VLGLTTTLSLLERLFFISVLNSFPPGETESGSAGTQPYRWSVLDSFLLLIVFLRLQ
jgi:hypothetical protein